MLKKSIKVATLSLIIFVAGNGVARADEVSFQGSTAGGFNDQVPGSVNSLLGLTYNSSTFNVTTSNGFLAIGAVPGTPNINNLGSFSLSSATSLYNGNTFTLKVTITNPTIIDGENPSTYNANVVGSVTTTTQGGVFIKFELLFPQTFSFARSDGSTGQFTFDLNDVSVTAGEIVSISGQIQVSPD